MTLPRGGAPIARRPIGGLSTGAGSAITSLKTDLCTSSNHPAPREPKIPRAREVYLAEALAPKVVGAMEEPVREEAFAQMSSAGP